jgi:hypothetical protein
MATIYPSLVKSYAKAIYIDGTKKFTDILPAYVEPTKEYAATGVVNGTLQVATFTGYTDEQIQTAFDKGFINDQELLDTMNYKLVVTE